MKYKKQLLRAAIFSVIVLFCFNLEAQSLQIDQLGELSNINQALQSNAENEPVLQEDEITDDPVLNLQNIKNKCRLRDEISIAKYSIICEQIKELEKESLIYKPKDFKFIVQQKNLDHNLKLKNFYKIV